MSAVRDQDVSTLAGRIAYARDLEGRSQNAIEQELIRQKLIASRGTMSRLEGGKRGGSTVDPLVLSAIARILHVNLEWLASGHGPIRRDGRVQRSPFEEAMAFARQSNCREDAIENAWQKHRDRSPKLTTYDWIVLIDLEARSLETMRIPRPEAVYEHHAEMQKEQRKLEKKKTKASEARAVALTARHKASTG
jgi:transcriptional regulator with XRE-family HTH domain